MNLSCWANANPNPNPNLLCLCRYPYAQNPRAGTGRLVRVLAFSAEDDTGTVLYSAVPILAKCHYWNIRDSTEDDTGTGLSD